VAKNNVRVWLHAVTNSSSIFCGTVTSKMWHRHEGCSRPEGRQKQMIGLWQWQDVKDKRQEDWRTTTGDDFSTTCQQHQHDAVNPIDIAVQCREELGASFNLIGLDTRRNWKVFRRRPAIDRAACTACSVRTCTIFCVTSVTRRLLYILQLGLTTLWGLRPISSAVCADSADSLTILCCMLWCLYCVYTVI